jgi:acetoin utilization deacetylase AcuC-like enzyme
MAGVFLAHPSSLEHETGGHPERASRITAIEQELEARDWLGYARISSPAVDRGLLAAVHPESHIAAIEQLAAGGGGMVDPDTVASPGSFVAAGHAAGGAVRLVELLLDGEAEYGFSAHRPPGHHATRDRAMGFCLFNNVAVAARFALDHHGLERVMILDWDVHHGNGTNDIFHASDDVLFVSIHESPLYPGSGPAGDAGEGQGLGFTVNLPVPGGSGDEEFRSLVDYVALPLAQAFQPQLVLVSAGYDAHRDDPLATCRMTEAGYAALTGSLRDGCRAMGAPVGCLLEGGYAPEALARSVAATMEALSQPGRDEAVAPPGPDEAAASEPDQAAAAPPVTRLVEEALVRLRAWWPV